MLFVLLGILVPCFLIGMEDLDKFGKLTGVGYIILFFLLGVLLWKYKTM